MNAAEDWKSRTVSLKRRMSLFKMLVCVKMAYNSSVNFWSPGRLERAGECKRGVGEGTGPGEIGPKYVSARVGGVYKE